ncbi:MAG: BatD family protein [Alphaproteobacteria bacterium]|nr:BatD family protein [Alphaproteobacteria bacterium]
MVRSLLIMFFISIFLPIASFAAEFIASVDQNQINVGNSFMLQLKLSGASSKGHPDISELQENFIVLGKQQLSNTTIINGNLSTSMSWQYRLTPKKEGIYKIPSIKIESSEGVLTSQPISVSVEKGSGPSNHEDKETTFSASVNKRTPYKNEPVIYTVRLTTQETLVNAQAGDFSLEGAMIKPIGKPKIYERVENGIPNNIIELKYIITPLKSGSVRIPGFLIQGQKVVQDKSPFDSVFGRGGDPFDILRRLQNLGTERLEPFSLTSNEVVLDVKAPPQNRSSWLPAESLKISESLPENQSFKVGEPFTRSFTIVGEGIAANQLPSLKDQQGKGAPVKIYGDKPTTEDSFKKNTLTSWREESYTLVPQQPGKLTLPEISVPWWNTKENKLAYATLPERTLEIAPGAQTPPASPPLPQSITPEKAEEKIQTPPPTETSQEASHVNHILYGIIGALIFLLSFTFLWIFKLKKGRSHREITMDKKEPTLTDKIAKRPASDLSNQELLNMKTPEEVYHFLQAYGQSHWGAPQNASLEILLGSAKNKFSYLSQEDIEFVIKNLHNALYGDKDIPLEEVKKRCLNLILAMKKKEKKGRVKTKNLPDLNPT